MQPELRFIENYDFGKSDGRLQQKRCQGHKAERPVREQMRAEKVILSFFPPIQADIIFVQWGRPQYEITELGQNQLNMANNALVMFFPFLVVSHREKEGSQVGGIVSQVIVVTYVALIANLRCSGCIVKVVNLA